MAFWTAMHNPVVKFVVVTAGSVLAYTVLSVAIVVLLLAVSAYVVSDTGKTLEETGQGQIVSVIGGLALMNLLFVVPGLVCLLFAMYFLAGCFYILSAAPRAAKVSVERRLAGELESENANVRSSAVLECGSRRLLKAEAKLSSMVLTDPDLDVRLLAYYVLEGWNRPQMRAILGALDSAPNKGYKLSLIRLLAKLTNNRQVFALTDQYLKDPDLDVRAAILDAFSGFYPADTIDLLLKIMDATEDKALKLKLLGILHKYDHILSVEPLVKLLKVETDRDVKLSIYSILRDIKDVRSNELFLQALHDSDPKIRNMAAEALKALDVKFARDVTKEIVKVPCKYCGTLVDVTTSKCSSCGAPVHR